MRYVWLAFQRVNGDSSEIIENGDVENRSDVSRKGGEKGDLLSSCMQIALVCAESKRDLEMLMGCFIEVCISDGIRWRGGIGM